jgi:GNAT superfamily N-acetyltransferase
VEPLDVLLHANLMTVTGWMGEGDGAAVERRDGELLMASRSEMPFLNCAVRSPGDTGDAGAFLERAEDFFFARHRGFVAYAHDGDPDVGVAAERMGMALVVPRYPEMACRSRLEAVSADVRPVQSLEEARAYWAVCDASYPSLGFPPGLFAQAFGPGDLLDAKRVEACLAWEDGAPVACASIWLTGAVGMVGWVAALPRARGRGLAAACTVWATNRAFDHGAEVAALQASTMGEATYLRLGYEHRYAYRLYGAHYL